MDSNLYARQPLGEIAGIPRFSEISGYILNYMKIAFDHVSAIRVDSVNPFMEDPLYFGLHRETAEIVKRYLKPNQVILDVGVGLGELLSEIKGCRRFGVDLSIDYLKIARSKDIEAVMCLAEELPYHDSVFDVVVAVDVLEHVLDLSAVTKSISRVLKTGGYLLVRVPYEEDLSPYKDPTLPYEYVHLRSFSEPELLFHFEKTFKFKHIETTYSMPYLQGHSRLTAALLTDSNRSRFAELSRLPEGFPILSFLQTASLEQLTDEMYRLKSDFPNAYEQAEGILVKPIVINAVFRKL